MSLNPAATMRRWPVASYFALAYLLSWSWWIPIAAAGDVVRPGDPWPTHMPGLLGPLLAALVVTGCVGGRPALDRFARRLVRWHGGWPTAVLAASPLALFAIGVFAVVASGTAGPGWQDLFVISGLPAAALPMLGGLLILNGFGEEGGWRGFAQERLQRRHGPVRAALFTALAWAGWHAPLFAILASFRGFSAALLPGFFLGMVAGALVLAHVYNVAGGSIAAAACWHVAYNLASATAAAQGTVAIVATTIVMIQAGALLAAAYQHSRRHLPSPLLGNRSTTARSEPDEVSPNTQLQH
jgi:membrane protease YdiL (CAAX protease family)